MKIIKRKQIKPAVGDNYIKEFVCFLRNLCPNIGGNDCDRQGSWWSLQGRLFIHYKVCFAQTYLEVNKFFKKIQPLPLNSQNNFTLYKLETVW